MKIVSLTAENVKKLRAVQITPNGSVVEITGRNGAGKTSVLDSIWYALGGTKSVPSQPIRQGEQQARIRLDLGEVVVTRRFTASGSTITVENADGARSGRRPAKENLPRFCTLTVATPIVNLPPTDRMVTAGFNKPKPASLSECIAHFFGEELDGAHDAMVDARACARLYFHLMAMGAGR